MVRYPGVSIPTRSQAILASFFVCTLNSLHGMSLRPSSTVETGAASLLWEGPPYPGLRPFKRDETIIFFGRSRETDALIAQLRDADRRFLAIVGASGTGKSSLVYAGLLSRLAAGAIEGSATWRALSFNPGSYGDNPFVALAAALILLLQPNEHREPIEIANALANTPAGIAKYIDQALAGAPASAQLLIFIDQMEELFVRIVEGNYQNRFVDLLVEASGHPRARMLATLRADVLPQATAYPRLTKLLRTNAFVLGPPGHASLTDMIRRPAQLAGVALDEGLADEILKDAGGDPGALPLVAFCLKELYELRAGGSHRLTTTAYEELGRLRGAIGRRAEALLTDSEHDAALAKLFHAIVRVDATGNVTRRRAFRNELPLPKLVEKLINGRLLLAEDADDRAIVTLAHEALFTAWPALRDWIEDNRSKLQRLDRVLLSLASIDPMDRAYAAEALGGMGPLAPEVVSALLAALRDADEAVRRASATALGQIGPAAAEAIPALIDKLGDVYEVRRASTKAIGQIGPAAIPALTAALRGHVNERIRSASAAALGRIGSAALKAIPALIAALGDADEGVRRNSATALGQIGSAAVPALIAALRSAHEGVRRASATALGQIGPAAVEAIPALIAALGDVDEAVRRASATALGQIGPAAAEAIPALTIAVKDADERVRRASAAALGHMGPDAVAALIAVLGDNDEGVRSASADSAGADRAGGGRGNTGADARSRRC